MFAFCVCFSEPLRVCILFLCLFCFSETLRVCILFLFFRDLASLYCVLVGPSPCVLAFRLYFSDPLRVCIRFLFVRAGSGMLIIYVCLSEPLRCS